MWGEAMAIFSALHVTEKPLAYTTSRPLYSPPPIFSLSEDAAPPTGLGCRKTYAARMGQIEEPSALITAGGPFRRTICSRHDDKVSKQKERGAARRHAKVMQRRREKKTNQREGDSGRPSALPP